MSGGTSEFWELSGKKGREAAGVKKVKKTEDKKIKYFEWDPSEKEL